MAFTPITAVHLLDVPLDNTYRNQIYFATAAAQKAYMDTRIKHSYSAFSFQRRDSAIRIPAHIDTLWDSNYVMYQNANFGSKWFYAFITRMEYVNDGMTHVYIETDVYQTWLEEAVLKPSFVVREHAMDDTPGSNLVEEGLDTGEYVRGAIQTDGLSDDLSIIVALSQVRASAENYNLAPGMLFDGIYSGLKFQKFDATAEGAVQVNNLISTYTDEGKGDAIVSIFMVPTWFYHASGGNLGGTGNKSSIDFEPPSSINGYVPKNNKLLCFPYRFIAASNNDGSEGQFRYEFFSDPAAPSFEMCGNSLPPAEVICYPLNYKGLARNYSERLVLSGFPTCSWTTDVYKNWLAQNRVSLGVSVAGIAAGAVAGGPFGIANGALKAAELMGALYEHSLEPAHAKGHLSSNANMSWKLFQFYFMPVSITAQFAQRIDSFFEMYGYKTNRVKIPNISGRPCWNYVETSGMNITGSLPSSDMSRLKKVFDDGCTFWKAGSYVGNYSLNNH